jgi:hypothetical protein
MVYFDSFRWQLDPAMSPESKPQSGAMRRGTAKIGDITASFLQGIADLSF